ncbi:MAG: hypothetical protein AAF682_23800 [Planctomycetota bacterium]
MKPQHLSLALGVALAGLGSVSAWSLVRESLHTSFGSASATLDQRAAWAFEHAAARLGVEADAEIFPALRELTPESAFVYFLGDAQSAATHNAYNHCEVLLYPRRFLSLVSIPDDWDPSRSGFDETVHLVAYEGFRDVDLAGWFDLLGEGQRFRLWRFRPQAGPGAEERD